MIRNRQHSEQTKKDLDSAKSLIRLIKTYLTTFEVEALVKLRTLSIIIFNMNIDDLAFSSAEPFFVLGTFYERSDLHEIPEEHALAKAEKYYNKALLIAESLSNTTLANEIKIALENLSDRILVDRVVQLLDSTSEDTNTTPPSTSSGNYSPRYFSVPPPVSSSLLAEDYECSLT